MALKQLLINDGKRKGLLNMQNIGLALVCLYIFTTFVAVDIVISSIFKSIALILMLCWTMFYIIRSWLKKEFPLSGYTAWYIVFIAISFITILYSQEYNILSGQFYLMLVNFCVTFSILVFIKNGFHFKAIAYSFIVSATILVIMLYAEGLLSGTVANRLGQDLMGNANIFAHVMMTGVMLGIWTLVYGSSRDSFKSKYLIKYFWLVKIILVTSIILCMYALILSGGRKYFVLPFLFLYILLIFKKDKNGNTHFWFYTIFAMIMVIIAYFLVMNVEPLYNAIGKRIETFLQGLLGTGDYDGSSAIRSTMRDYAMSMWLKNPIFGYGFDSFKYYNLTETGYFYYSHCNFTEMLFNGGVILFVAYYWIYYYIFKSSIKARSIPEKYRSFAIATVICSLLFDLLGISYSMLPAQIMLALAYKVLSFKSNS